MSALPKVRADFHYADRLGRLRLNAPVSVADLERVGAPLADGMTIEVHAQELSAIGVLRWSEEEDMWVAEIDWQGITESEDEH